MRAAWRNLSAHNGGGRNAIERPPGSFHDTARFGKATGGDHGHAFLLRRGMGLPNKPALTYEALLRSEEHTSELQSLMRISYAVLCLKKKTEDSERQTNNTLAEYKS